jgi:hypothetical protein
MHADAPAQPTHPDFSANKAPSHPQLALQQLQQEWQPGTTNMGKQHTRPQDPAGTTAAAGHNTTSANSPKQLTRLYSAGAKYDRHRLPALLPIMHVQLPPGQAKGTHKYHHHTPSLYYSHAAKWPGATQAACPQRALQLQCALLPGPARVAACPALPASSSALTALPRPAPGSLRWPGSQWRAGWPTCCRP